MELGCDARGYSRAGNDTKIWYCVIVAGRLSHELSKMRDVSLFWEVVLSFDNIEGLMCFKGPIVFCLMGFINKGVYAFKLCLMLCFNSPHSP